MKYLFILYLIASFFLPITSAGQQLIGLPLVNNYNKTIYQGGSRTWDIKQDSRGILYFGNSEGLITFDGRYWKSYALPNHTIIRSLWIDDHDRIYVGGQGEFGYFEPAQQGGLTYTSLKALIPEEYRNFADIWNTISFGQSVFFRATNVIFEFKGQKIKVHPAAAEWYFMGKVGESLFAQDKKNGLLVYRNHHWSPLLVALPYTDMKISAMIPLGKDRIVISTLNNQNYELKDRALIRLNKEGWEDSYTPSSARIDDSTFVIGNAKDGCHIRHINGKTIQRIGVREGLQNKNISAVFVDQQQHIWVASDNCISVISYGSALRYLRPNLENDVTGLSSLIFDYKLYLSSSNGVYVAPITKGMKDQSRSLSSFSLFPKSDGGEAWLLKELNGHLLLGHNKGLFQVKDQSLIPISNRTGIWNVLPLSSVYPVDHALVGTYQGFELLHYEQGSFHSGGQLRGILDSYRFIEQDDRKTIWASHPYRGIYRMRLAADRQSYQADLFTKKNGLPSDYQNFVFKIKDQVVFATEKGLYRYDYGKHVFVPALDFKVFDGLTIRYLKEDQDGNIWFCTNKSVGVAQFDPKGKTYQLVKFPEMEGMNTSGFDHINTYDKNNIYIVAEKGIIHLNYEKYIKEARKPTVLLSHVTVKSSRDSIIFAGYFPKNLSGNDKKLNAEEPQLASNLNSFQFAFSSPSYGIHEHVEFSYQLVGYDENWSPWAHVSEKSYTNLPSGHYRFQVKVRNNLNQISEVSSYGFTILPPWYLSFWAKLIYVILGGFAVYGFFTIQKQIWKRQRLQYEKKMEQLRYIHQLEIEKSEKEIVKLNNEKLEQEVLLKTKELASASMKLLENSGTLVKVRDELAKLEIGEEEASDLKRVHSLLKDVEKNSANWDQFASHFDELNDGFLNKLKSNHSGLSRNDLKVCAYLKLNFTTKQIAQLQNITVRGVEIHRYRLRKKLPVGKDQSLSDFLNEI